MEEDGGFDWGYVDYVSLSPTQKAEDTQSDIEVISNPSTVHTDQLLMERPATGPLLYSEILAAESDIEFVPEPDSPELEYDDEYLVDQLLQDQHLEQDRFLQESSSSTEAGDIEEEEEEEESDSETAIPDFIPYPMTEEDCERECSEVVLEVNLTLLSFTLIVGVSGMSGFLLGGIYSAVLTNNIQHETALTAYPGVLPSFLYSEEMPAATCPALDSCQSKVYRVEQNMKQLKDTLSQDVNNCQMKLKSVFTQNAALYHTNSATAQHCSKGRAEVAELQAKSAALLSEIESQNVEMQQLRHTRDTEAAQTLLHIASLAQSLDNTKSELEEARRAVTVLDNLNNDCRNAQSSALATRAVKEEGNFWKNLYKNAIIDLEEAERKVGSLEKALRSEMRELEKSQETVRETKTSYLKERNAKTYYKNLSEKYSSIVMALEKKLGEVKGRSHNLGEKIAALQNENEAVEFNLQRCSKSSAFAEEKLRAAISSKQYIESLLINKISHNREDYQVLKRLYFNQEQALSELESQKSTLEETLIRKINSKKQKAASVKEELGSKKLAVEEELERSRAEIAALNEQMQTVEQYTTEMAARMTKMKEEVVMRDAIQREYIASRERELSRCEANTTKQTALTGKVREVEGKVEHWKQSARYSEHQNVELADKLIRCRNSKVTAVEEYKKTNIMLLDLLQDISTKPQVLRVMQSTSRNGGKFSLLQQLYNSSMNLDFEQCYPAMRPLFPSVAQSTLSGVVNMTQGSDKSAHKMSGALEKYWGGVDKVYTKLSRKVRKPQGPQRDMIKGEHSTLPRRSEKRKGDFDCDRFDCSSVYHFGFELCGC